MSVQLLGDTGAAYDIGSLQALQQQGIDPEFLQPWISCLQNPVRLGDEISNWRWASDIA